MRAVLVGLLLLAPVALAGAEPDVEAMMAELLAQGVGIPGPRAAGIGLSTVPDAGYGLRTEDYPCYVATLLNVFHLSFDGVPRDGLAIERTVLAPEPFVPCGYGFESWLGEARGIVAHDAYDWVACTAFEGGFGGWALVSDPCHVGDFDEATLTGRVGVVRIATCQGNVCVTLQQVFGGTNNAPGYVDVASIRVA